MPNPFISILVLAAMFILSLTISFLLSLIYSVHSEIPEVSEDTDRIFYVGEFAKKRRIRRKRKTTTVAIRGKIISPEELANRNGEL